MNWRPLNPINSVERVRFVIKFREAVPSKLSRQISEKLGSMRHDVRLSGPTPVPGLNFAVKVTADGQQLVAPQQLPPGWQFTRLSSDGQPLEVVALTGDLLTYETVEYRRWTAFRQRFLKVVDPLVGLAANSLDVDSISLESLNRFFFNGRPEVATPSSILVGIDRMIHGDASSGRTLFHVHRGWFEASAFGDLLVNLNFDAGDAVNPGREDTARSIGILTKIEARAAVFPVEKIDRSSLLDLLHEVMKSNFVRSIDPSLHSAIGIT